MSLPPPTGPRPRGISLLALRHSVLLLAGVILMALIGLAAAGNWPKVLRVGLAFGAYAMVLLTGSSLRARSRSRVVAPYWLFAAAGAGAGLVSGLVRPTIQPAVVLVSILAGAFLLSTVHWGGALSYEKVLDSNRGPHRLPE